MGRVPLTLISPPTITTELEITGVSVPMLLINLPSETIVYILTLTSPSTIRLFRQLSSVFSRIVVETPLLQHILALGACGCVAPRVPRQDLGLVDQVNLLRAHHHRISISATIPAFHVRVEVPRSQRLGVNLVSYNEGLFAQYSRATKYLSIYQFPSLNHGVHKKEWRHRSPAANLVSLSTSAAIDLLVWLEACHPHAFETHVSTLQDYRYKIHLRSLASNLKHPEAQGGLITHQFQAPHTITGHTVHILGNLLAVLFVSASERASSRVAVWDWTTGLEVTRVTTPGGFFTSFAFLSEHYFVITRNSSFLSGQNRITTGTYGRLCVYDLNSFSGENVDAPAQLVSQLLLPNLPRGVSGSSIQIRTTNSPASSSYICSSSKGRLYDLPPSSQTLCLDVKGWVSRHERNEPQGTLLIPVNVLLEAVDPTYNSYLESSTHRTSLPWSEWARDTTWCDEYVDRQVVAQHAASSVMYARPSTIHDYHPGGIVLWDLGKKAHSIDVSHSTTAGGFFETATPPYIAVKARIELDARFLPLTCVMLDSEYIIAQTKWEEDGYTLIVYHF